jgi:hypothetical protein
LAGQEHITRVEALLPIFELDRVGIQIESRMPEAGQEPADREPEVPRTVAFEAAAAGLLGGLNGKTSTLRRYGFDWFETDVAGSDSVDAQICDVTIKTGPPGGGYPIGPEFRLRFEVDKRPGVAYWALLLAVLGVASVAAASFLTDHVEWRIGLVVLGALLILLAGYMWTGRVKLPGGK